MRRGADENSGKLLGGNLEENGRSHNKESLWFRKGVFVGSQQWV